MSNILRKPKGREVYLLPHHAYLVRSKAYLEPKGGDFSFSASRGRAEVVGGAEAGLGAVDM